MTRIKSLFTTIAKKRSRRWKNHNDVPSAWLFAMFAICGMESWYWFIPVREFGTDFVIAANRMPMSTLFSLKYLIVFSLLILTASLGAFWGILSAMNGKILIDRMAR